GRLDCFASWGPASGFETFRRHLEPGKLKPRRDRTADQRIIAQASGRLPFSRRYHRLGEFASGNVRSQNCHPFADLQFQRCAAIKMPDFGCIDAMPARDLARLEQKQDGSGVGPAAARLVAKTFTEMAAF